MLKVFAKYSLTVISFSFLFAMGLRGASDWDELNEESVNFFLVVLFLGVEVTGGFKLKLSLLAFLPLGAYSSFLISLSGQVPYTSMSLPS